MRGGMFSASKGGLLQWKPRVYQNGEITVLPYQCFYHVVNGVYVIVTATMQLKSAGTSNNGIYVTLPLPYPDIRIVSNNDFAGFMGQGSYLDNGTAGRPFTLMSMNSLSTVPPDRKNTWVQLRSFTTTAATDDALGLTSTGNFAVASGDELSFASIYPYVGR